MAQSTRALYVELCNEPPTRAPRPAARLAPPRRRPEPADLTDVARLLGVEVRMLTGSRQDALASGPRQEAMWLLYHGRELSTVAIGRLLGRDPSTIRYGILAAETRRGDDPRVTARLDRLKAELTIRG